MFNRSLRRVARAPVAATKCNLRAAKPSLTHLGFHSLAHLPSLAHFTTKFHSLAHLPEQGGGGSHREQGGEGGTGGNRGEQREGGGCIGNKGGRGEQGGGVKRGPSVYFKIS